MDIEELRARLKPVFERHGVRFALLFGSRARAGGVGRDYDIAISADLRSAIELGELIVDIAETLGVNEDLIDVVHLESAGAGILYSVINDGVVIHGDEEEAMNYLWRRYLELLNINEYLNHLERHMSPLIKSTTRDYDLGGLIPKWQARLLVGSGRGG
ncbi:nucleotidyltransferase domain-containing protein [Vulcanisaeta souniana]|uniref:nucleotidyltransferase domain-containing protein n=1 Tax=Vulcanisaeta souniana TaxID=164452 RepID=UPI000AF3890D|nr:nucleotidyltransferase domain-containing protein [Vulcanisaeta souniana]